MHTPLHSAFTDAEVTRFRSETTGCRFVNHLNNAGAGLMPDVATNALLDHIKLESEIGGYEAAHARVLAIGEFYKEAALLVNARPGNIAFTASATDSYTRALSSIPFNPGDTILTDCDDFISNQIQFLSCRKRFGVNIVHIKNAATGGVDLTDLEARLFELKPRLLAITHIPTNSGLVQPVNEIAEIFSRYRKTNPGNTWYILDACQSIGQMKIDVQYLECDFLSVTNRKFLRGPRGTGFLFISDRVLNAELEPLFLDMRGAEWVGKDQYKQQPDAKRFEDWEFAFATVVSSSEAIRYCRKVGEDRIQKQVQLLSGYLREQLAPIPGVRLLDGGMVVSASTTFTVKGHQPDHLVAEFRAEKINVVASYRNFAVIDFGEKDVDWAIRVSPHYYNTTTELDAFIDAAEHMLR